jgi:hypothetical protein
MSEEERLLRHKIANVLRDFHRNCNDVEVGMAVNAIIHVIHEDPKQIFSSLKGKS